MGGMDEGRGGRSKGMEGGVGGKEGEVVRGMGGRGGRSVGVERVVDTCCKGIFNSIEYALDLLAACS